MDRELFESEAKVMEIVWNRFPISAKEISLIAAKTIGWNKNTTYTVIKKLVEKGFLYREEPGFMCSPAVSKTEMQKKAAFSLLRRVFGGSKKALFSSLLNGEKLSEEERKELLKLIERR